MKTEGRNERARNLHRKETREVLRIINEADRSVADSVREVLPEIEAAVDLFVSSFRDGGMIFYVGAGTSGRIGVLDASEIPPTFGVSEDRVNGLIAGGREALTSARESREDDVAAGRALVEDRDISETDFVVGVSASGRTPFVLGFLEAAGETGTATAAITNNKEAPIDDLSGVTIVAETGPEIIAGSTRMKAGTAQKMVLNMLSTASMVRLGKVFDNLMVDVVPSNEKLKKRARKIVRTVTGAENGEIEARLKESDYDVKATILTLELEISLTEARRLLDRHDGHLGKALEETAEEQ